MEQTPIRAVEMVRSIRDSLHEETKGLTRDELKRFYAMESAALREELLAPSPAREAPPGSLAGATRAS